jgi:hypothetical protein
MSAVARRWRCEFTDDRESRVIMIGLDFAEMEAARSAADPAVTAAALALRRAYKMLPSNFRHRSVEPAVLS